MTETEDSQAERHIRLEAVFLIYLLSGAEPEDLMRAVVAALEAGEQLTGPWASDAA